MSDTKLAARLRQMTDAWEQRLPDTIRTAAVVSAIRAALETTAPAVDRADRCPHGCDTSTCPCLACEADQTERRNRYDAAIREADGWVLDDGQHMIDAVLTVADAEQTELRTHAEQVEELLAVAHETSNRSEAERARAVQRAELADAVTAETKRLMDRRTTTLRKRAERAEAVIERVREVPAFVEKVIALSGPGVATYKVREIAERLSAALDGAVLPEPDGRAAVYTEVAADFEARAAALNEGVDDLAAFVAKARMAEARIWTEAADELRRLADEAQQEGTL